DSKNHLRIAARQADGKYAWRDPIGLKKPKDGAAHPAGIARDGDRHVWLTATRTNSLQHVNLETGKVDAEVPVGVAPYQVLRLSADRFYVSSGGGDPPKAADPQAKTSGTSVRIDPRTSIADDGTVSVIERVEGGWRQKKTIRVGLHSSGMTASA